ncbi:uncharacterized protein PAC_15672 [Phialocephala subalpina]|uniref:Uncharacterized protein n=1 Tax=Phialocephala subalpina TaxID=576137 RepID=A0A1L7XL58_9HELO|nr:uncharacterized protein PAC_15672 [Phialocephala subalpina]
MLSQYRVIEHARSRRRSFYFNPHRDVLWLSFDCTDQPDYLRDLERCYGKQLNAIESLLVEELEWGETTPVGYSFDYLAPFKGLQTILILFGDNDKDASSDTKEDLDNENNDGECGEDNSEDSDENSDQGSKIEAGGLYACADIVKAEYTEFLKDHEGIAKSIRCMDRSGTFY